MIPLLCCAIWAYLLAFRDRFWLARDESKPVAPAPARRVAVVIPARNEAATIARAVASLNRQDYSGEIQVIVVDDDSDDGTAALARDASATVIRASPLPAGWTGKMWAVSQGLEKAFDFEPDYVLLTDADIEHSPDNVCSLIARAERDSLDLTSYMVRLANRSIAERFAIPAFVFFFFKLFTPGDGSRGAAGGCMLVRAAALQRIDGVSRIRGEIIDDCALAREIQDSGGGVWLGLSSKTRSLRSYGTFGEISNMIARTAFTQLNHSAWMLAGTVLGMSLIYLVPPVSALYGSRPGAIAWLMMTIAYVPMLRFYGQSVLWAPFLPLVALFYTAATIQSAILYWSGKGGSWKGRAQAQRAGR